VRPNLPDVVTNEIRPLASSIGPTTTGSVQNLPAIGASSGQYLTLGGVRRRRQQHANLRQ